jgi:hypothetical protein
MGSQKLSERKFWMTCEGSTLTSDKEAENEVEVAETAD